MSKKEAILQRSTQVFLETGLNKISMDELADKIGITKKTIYNNYGSKDNLLKAIIETAVLNVVENIKNILLDKNITIIDKVESVFKFIYTFHTAFEQPLNNDPAANIIMNSPLCIALDCEVNEAIYELCVEAKDKGYIKDGINIEMFPHIFNNIINSTASWVRPDNVSFSKMDLMRQTIQLVLDGIIAPEKHHLFPNLNN